MRKITAIMFAAMLLFLFSCGERKQGNEPLSLLGVQSILWSQYSAEAEALYLQGFNIASRITTDSAAISKDKRWAVVLDIDETVLDNSPFNVEMLRSGASYSEEIWAEWCEMRKAITIPGALEFTQLAAELGVEVFYVSNRKENLLDATLDNMLEFGFPFTDEAHVMLKKETSSKDARREAIRENYTILLLLGDNLGDFDGVFDERAHEYGKETVREFKEAFGTHFIMLPNPMYGSWQRGAFPEGMPEENEILEFLRGY